MIEMIDAVVNMKEFTKDVEDGMSAFDLKKKYVLTPRQFRKLVENIERKNPVKRKKSKMKRTIRTYFNEPYISVDANTGKYAIRKDKIYFGMYDSLDIAKEVKEKLIEENWDKSKLNDIRCELDLKPMKFRK